MERNNALSIIIEEADSLDLNVFAQLDEHSDVNGDEDFDDDDESWPSVADLDPDLFTYAQPEQPKQQLSADRTTKLSRTQELMEISVILPPVNVPQVPLYIAEKPKSAKEAAAYIKEKYEALNRLRLEAGLGSTPSPAGLLSHIDSGDVAIEKANLRPDGCIVLPQELHNDKLSDVSSRLHQLHSNQTSLTTNGIYSNKSRDTAHPMAAVVEKKEEGVSVSGKMLSEQAVAQVELFYRSRKSDVHVCPCHVHLYQAHDMSLAYPSLSLANNNNNKSLSVSFPRDWNYVRTGVAVLLLEDVKDDGGGGGGCRMSVILAELGTGFLLWQETVDQYSDYHAIQVNFHALRLHHHPTSFAGFAFDDPQSAAHFLQRMREFATRAAHLHTNNNCNNNNNSNNKGGGRRKKTKKSDISSPCCFSHLTSLDQSAGAQLLAASSTLQRQAMNLLQQYSTMSNNSNSSSPTKTADIGSRFVFGKR